MTAAMDKFFKSDRGGRPDGGSYYDDLIALVGPAFPYDEYEVAVRE